MYSRQVTSQAEATVFFRSVGFLQQAARVECWHLLILALLLCGSWKWIVDRFVRSQKIRLGGAVASPVCKSADPHSYPWAVGVQATKLLILYFGLVNTYLGKPGVTRMLHYIDPVSG